MNNIDNLIENLNKEQKEAVLNTEGPNLIVAGAGSGKTKTLTYRVARLVNEGVHPSSILLLTFTRKSAQEMLRRATQILDDRCQNVSGGTFHSFANLTLRKYAANLGYQESFTIMDRSDAEDLISMIRKEYNYGKLDKRFPKKGTIMNVVSKAINTSKPVDAILAKEYPQFLEFEEEIVKIAVAYKKRKKAMHMMDYDDLLVQVLELLKNDREVRQELQKKYKYILVDEYQDTNAIQAEIVWLLANESMNVMVVGDDSQSIYSFRGADFKNIMSFPEKFSNAKVITLEENYRSTQSILDITNALISRAKEKYTKNLFSSKPAGSKPIYLETDSDNMQSRFICQKILELRESGQDLRNIAVLIRSGYHSNDLEVELQAHNLPFVKHGGFRFVETSHVKDAIAFLKVAHNPADAISWQRVLVLFEGLGAAGAMALVKSVGKKDVKPEEVDIEHLKNKPYFEQLKNLLAIVFQDNIEAVKPTEILEKVLSFYDPLFIKKYDDNLKRKPDLDSLESIAERYDNLETFLSEITLEPPEKTQVDSLVGESDDEKLVISTIHSAKGLEWDTVFVLSVVDGYIPSFKSLGDFGQIEEERRLLYVAMTRAKTNLFIIKPNLDNSNSFNYYRYSGMDFSKISRFLDEAGIIEDYAQRVALVEEKPDNPDPMPWFNSGSANAGASDNGNSNRKKYFF